MSLNPELREEKKQRKKMDCEILAARERSMAKKNPNMNYMGENFDNKRIAATTKQNKKHNHRTNKDAKGQA